MGVSIDEPTYAHRTPCDLVMKGGVASGIVYPGAIAELSKRYQFHGVGGSSAGAIGALGAAAAELGRYRRGDDSSFEQVDSLARELTEKDDIIAGFFQPSPSTRPIFDAVVALGDAGIGRRATVLGKAAVAHRAALPRFPAGALIGAITTALPGALFLIPAAGQANAGGPFDVLILVAIALLALLGVVVGATLGVLYQAQRSFRVDVRDNFWGMCSGLSQPEYEGTLGLTDWMDQLTEQLAAPTPGDEPVTFGDLWYADSPDEYTRGEHPAASPSSRAINLQVITTCLSDGQPYRFPFQPAEDDRQQFYFRSDEMRKLFPARIVAWLEAHPPEGIGRVDDYRPLPNPADLPILMAARLSLSFPALLSAVPLYRRDVNGEFRLCWFSDGGIASNFPIHFFDSPVPRWPTLAISLAGAPEQPCSDEDWRDHPEICQERSIWLASQRQTKLDNVSDFGMAIFNTARNWSDNTQADLPGYRDRIIYVGMNPGEGGLNLNMPQVIRQRLSDRGALAGAQIRDRFHLPDGDDVRPTMLWDLHRWTRFRSSMSVIQRFLGAFHRGYGFPDARPTYDELMEQGIDGKQPYQWRDTDHLKRALDATADLDAVATNWNDGGNPEFGVGAPKPAPEIRIRPRI